MKANTRKPGADTVPPEILRNKQTQQTILKLSGEEIKDEHVTNIFKTHTWLQSLEIQNSPLNASRLLPSSISMKQLQRVSLHNCSLDEVPKYLRTIPSIVELELCSNSISKLKPSFAKLTNLKILKLRNNKFTKFPSTLLEMKLEVLDLSENALNSLGVEFAIHRGRSRSTLHPPSPELNSVTLSSSPTSGIPFLAVRGTDHTTFKTLASSLHTLSLAKTGLTSFPENVYDLEHLKELDLSDNKLTKFDTVKFECFLSLRRVHFQNCGFDRFPESLCSLTKLNYINLSGNSINVIPLKFTTSAPYIEDMIVNSCGLQDMGFIVPCRILKRLHASNNKIRQIPVKSLLNNHNSIEEMILSHNLIEELPAHIEDYKYLKTLIVNHNRITQIDSKLNTLHQLRELDLSFNQLRQLPNDMNLLKDLRRLNISNNLLSSLPDLSSCKYLRQLNASSNRLVQLSGHGKFCTSFSSLNLSNNQLTEAAIADVYTCTGLDQLDLSRNLLSTIDPAISSLKYLIDANFDYNYIQEIPETIAGLEFLSNIYARYCAPVVKTVACKATITVEFEDLISITQRLSIGSGKLALNTLYLQKKKITHLVQFVHLPQVPRTQSFDSNFANSIGLKYNAILVDPKEDGVDRIKRYVELLTLIMDTENATVMLWAEDDKEETSASEITLIGELQACVIGCIMHIKRLRLNKAQSVYTNAVAKSSTLQAAPAQVRASCTGVLPEYYNKILFSLDKSIFETQKEPQPLIRLLLENDTNRHYFKQFCQSEKSVENILFWEHVAYLYKEEKSNSQRRMKIAKKIFDTFVSQFGAHPLNIDGSTYHNMEAKLATLEEEYHQKSRQFMLPDDLFDELLHVVEKTMLDTVQRFQRHSMYSQMQQSVKAEDVTFQALFTVE